MHTIRQTCGLAGFPKREESAHDAFGAGHSSTSISAGLGMLLIHRGGTRNFEQQGQKLLMTDVLN